MIGLWLQRTLEEANYVDPLQSGSRPKTALITLVDDIWKAQDESNLSIWVIFDLSIAFYTINYDMGAVEKIGSGDHGSSVVLFLPLCQFQSFLL